MISEEIKQYLVRVCTILNLHNVEYIVVGGAAVSHYGFNRPSGIGRYNTDFKADLDFWYNPTIENFQNLIQALDELDVDTSDLKKLVFDKKRTFLKIPHELFHMDFLPDMAGLNSFRNCNSKTEIISLDGVALRILSYNDLIANKRAVNRVTDQIDIYELSAQQAPSEATIVINQLGKRFNREWIFRNLSFEFSPGSTYAITGPNGSGKSTLLQVLWGQMPQSVGQIEYQIAGKSIPAEEIYSHLSIATPYMDLIDEFTLEEQIRFHFKLKESHEPMGVNEMMERMYLTHARDKFIGNFSSGMRQRVKLALAFFTRADIVFLDEPGTNLDQQAFEWYLSELRNLPKTTTLFIASNQPSEYPAEAQKINIMDYK